METNLAHEAISQYVPLAAAERAEESRLAVLDARWDRAPLWEASEVAVQDHMHGGAGLPHTTHGGDVRLMHDNLELAEEASHRKSESVVLRQGQLNDVHV